MKTHTLNSITPGSPSAYLANGIVGLRVGPVPLPSGTALVNGFVGLSPENRFEAYADAPYPIGADIELDGVWLSKRPDLARFERQDYDFSCGELTSCFSFTVNGKTARVEVLTFCSRTQPTLSLQEVAITVDAGARVTLQAHIGRQGLLGEMKYRLLPSDRFTVVRWDAVIEWESRQRLSTLGVCTISEMLGPDAVKRNRNDYGTEEEIETSRYEFAAKPGQRYVMRQIASMVPSLMHGEPHWEACRLVSTGCFTGFDELRAANRDAWAELWKGRVQIHAADSRWQDVADAAFFYIHSSVSPSSPCSVAPFGLSRRVEYYGHVFWDADNFVMPVTMLTAPATARAMMEYRSQHQAAARANAQLNGYRGLQFPGTSSNHGWEHVPYYAATCNIEQHSSLDIALAMAQFVHSTGDERFFRQHAWPVIEGVADWIVSRVTKTARGYEIRHITCPDETRTNVHNSSFTNILAILTLREAIGFAPRMGFQPPAEWVDVERHMYLPVDPKTNVLLKHEGYVYEGGMCPPDTLAAFYPFGYRPEPAVAAATYKFHLDLAHTYLGMPMFSSFCSVWAAQRQDRHLAAEMLNKGVGDNYIEPYCQFIEATARHGYSDATKSVFLANAAGFLLTCYQGLPGIQIGPGAPADWCQSPVVLPEGWDAIEAERIWVRGQPMRLQARHGAARATLEKLS